MLLALVLQAQEAGAPRRCPASPAARRRTPAHLYAQHGAARVVRPPQQLPRLPGLQRRLQLAANAPRLRRHLRLRRLLLEATNPAAGGNAEG